ALALLPVAAPAQSSGVIEGRVLERDGGAPIAGVAVSVAGFDRATLSDAEGRFRIQGVPAGDHSVIARRVGLRPVTLSATVRAAEISHLDFALATEALLMPEVVVSTTREVRRLAETAASVGVVSGEELDQ